MRFLRFQSSATDDEHARLTANQHLMIAGEREARAKNSIFMPLKMIRPVASSHVGMPDRGSEVPAGPRFHLFERLGARLPPFERFGTVVRDPEEFGDQGRAVFDGSIFCPTLTTFRPPVQPSLVRFGSLTSLGFSLSSHVRSSGYHSEAPVLRFHLVSPHANLLLFVSFCER